MIGHPRKKARKGLRHPPSDGKYGEGERVGHPSFVLIDGHPEKIFGKRLSHPPGLTYKKSEEHSREEAVGGADKQETGDRMRKEISRKRRGRVRVQR